MKSLAVRSLSASVVLLLACGTGHEPEPDEMTTTLPPAESGGTDESSDTLDWPDLPDDRPPPCDPDRGCTNKIDLLFVIDNSGTMAEEQLNLARQFANLIEKLENLEDADGKPVNADVSIMVTTTDRWNPACNGPWVKEDYEARGGQPITTACTQRLTRFESFDQQDFSGTCTQVCSGDAHPEDPFIHFDSAGHNVIGGDPADALSCLGPQGVDGCGYESPLESMAQALNPDACWNGSGGCDGEASGPFMRDDAVLAVVMITDEADCSMKYWEAMNEDTFREIDPDSGLPETSSAMCWNAGVECTGFNAVTGEYDECHAVDRAPDGAVIEMEQFGENAPVLQPIDRYIDFLEQLKGDGREVVMLGILGVPEVTAYSDTAPHHPIEGGVEALVYRDWQVTDILPAEADAGVDVADKHAEFGIGPGCTGFEEGTTTSTGQAIPPVRVKEVCESLNEEDKVRCCIESICSTDFSPAIDCLTDILETVVQVG